MYRYAGVLTTVLLTLLSAANAEQQQRLIHTECNLALPADTTLWRSNQTQELLFPQVEAGENLKWDATNDMQSGDILLIRINDTQLVANNMKSKRITTRSIVSNQNSSTDEQQHNTREPASTSSGFVKETSTPLPATEPTQPQQVKPTETVSSEVAVYQVTRTGHDSCNITEGVLLDITPLSVDGKKVVALYDKDLSEGVNFLIIVSESWGGRCIQLRVTVKSDNCGENEDCSGKGMCFTNASMDGYECQCCPGYIGPHCEEQDACFPSPCKNHGICVDISQGHDGSTFQCLCPYGFTGKVCEDTSDPCESGPCQNGASCRPSNLTAQQFQCDCRPGYSGPLCQHNLDQCASSPCQHGICVDQHDGYRCFCQPGFAGDQCQYEYNECESSPCMNGGTCTDHIGSYSCNCGRGFTGKRCNMKVDLCDPNPCSHHHYCVDKGNTYSCECPKGFTGPNCLLPRHTACSANPCHNGGTCWSSVDSFYCACRPGFTGKICNGVWSLFMASYTSINPASGKPETSSLSTLVTISRRIHGGESNSRYVKQEEVIIEVIPSAAGAVEVTGNNQRPLDLQMPISIHLDHLHNIYVAAGTLACALLIVVFTVAACHCRIHETYKHCFLRATPLLPCNIKRYGPELKPTRLEVDKEHMQPLAATARSYPPLDNSEMYYALDFSDSQSSPLIQ